MTDAHPDMQKFVEQTQKFAAAWGVAITEAFKPFTAAMRQHDRDDEGSQP